DPADSADILEKLGDQQAARLIEELPTDSVIRIVDEMQTDEAADLLGDIHPSQAQAVLDGLEAPHEVRPLLLHPDDTAGGLMSSRFLALPGGMTAAQAIQAIRDWNPETGHLVNLFVVDEARRLRGIVSIRQLILAPSQTLLQDIMRTDVISVPPSVDQEHCAHLMSRYDLLELPVVDADDILLGVITVDDMVDVLVDEATEDIQRLGGAQSLEGSYLDTPVLTVARKRVGWLFILFVTESLTGTVLRHFESELHTVVALSFFIPLLIGTGGNAGSQTTSTIIRALAVGDINLGDATRAFWHEMRTGLLLGLGMAVIAYIRALIWGSTPALAVTVSLAVAAIVVWANALGSILPLLAQRLRVDPAIVSGPVMSTLVDATGLFIYFSIAKIVLGL
ncbi:MAG TPA: magnesium transporter, partial [Propionibacteriaceae bacterium]|nr:magnesium transporter [Propionibacteriaceae bacterium]